jgi:hypothetical protein
MQDFYFYNGLISNIDYYYPSIQGSKTKSEQYRFSEDTLFVTKTYFNENGTINSSSENSIIVDNYNGEFPDIGIPGYHHMFDYLFLNIAYTFPKVLPRYDTYIVKYNESGNLFEWINLTDYGSLGPFTLASFQYE